MYHSFSVIWDPDLETLDLEVLRRRPRPQNFTKVTTQNTQVPQGTFEMLVKKKRMSLATSIGKLCRCSKLYIIKRLPIMLNIALNLRFV